MTWMDRMSALLARKSSRAGAAVAAIGLAPARWTPRRYDRLAEEGRTSTRSRRWPRVAASNGSRSRPPTS